ncbi:MAG: hypothetical protein K0R38_1317 [Polyangiaceae bacterium]|jgi:hypothetical protein|nr:hypothetical protein [Polyangiaceae bacterium]
MKAVRGAIFLTAALVLSAPDAARAQSPSATSDVPAPSLKLWLDARGASFDVEKLRASLAKELKRDVELTSDAGAASVRVRLESEQRADVRYTTPSGEELSRSVDLPPDRERSVQVVSWLTVNLVRDEASELLSELRARRRSEAEARAAQEQAAADRAAADKAAADKVAADQAAAAKAAADAAAKKSAEQAKTAENGAGGPKEEEGILRDPKKAFDVALATPISLVRDSAKRELHVQAALWYGESGALRGIGVSPIALRVRKDLEGVLVGTAVALVGRTARGFVVSAGYAQLDGVLEGVLVGAGAAVHRGKLGRGMVVAAGGVVAGELTGIVVGGGFASARTLHGVGVAGGITLTRGRSEGLLVAGGANFSSDHRGVEVAGGVNIARDLEGIALAPVNLHRRVKGLQLGIVNVAEEVDGLALGVISYAKNGRLQPTSWTSTEGSVHVAVKSIAGSAFTQLGAGIDVKANSFTYDGGVGAHFRLTESLFFEPGVHYSGKHRTRDLSGAPDEHRLHYLAQFGYRVGNKVDFLGAAGVRNVISGGTGASIVPELRAGIAFF